MNARPIHLSHLLGYVGLAVLIMGFCVYVAWQARFLIIGPTVMLQDEPPVVQTNRTITLSGTAENITAITINDRPIQTDAAGNFTESIILENGYTIVSIKAQDRYGRETMIERPYVFVPKTLLQ